jgi:hypothetical protein
MIKRYFRRHPIRTKRALEILPGFTSWFLILFPIWGSFLVPKFVAYYVIIFAVYWLYRSINLAIFAGIAQNKVRKNSQNDILPQLKKTISQTVEYNSPLNYYSDFSRTSGHARKYFDWTK